MKVFADKVNNRLSVCFEKADDKGAFIEQNILHLFSFEPNEDYRFVMEKTSETLKTDYSFKKEKLFCTGADSLSEEEIFESISAFVKFVFSEKTENKLTDYSAVLVEEKSFKLLDSLVFLNPSKCDIIKGFVSGLSEDNSLFDQGLKTELIDSCQKGQGEAELLSVIDRYANPGKYMIKVCPGCGKEYEFEANYCLNCGLKLETSTKEEQEADGTQEKLSVAPFEPEFSDKEKTEGSLFRALESKNDSKSVKESGFGETTLLGFTNFGETSVLGGLATDFATPNLVRTSTGEKVFITKRNFIIGKSVDSADFVINNAAVSRIHAEITAIGNEYYVKDKNSTNHTYVNNQILSPEETKQIFEGDEIKLADESLIFHLY